MATLNFPTSPSLNDTYSFNGKTWVWNGLGWQLQSQGAINGIVIGNSTPAAGTFTALSATGNIIGDNVLTGGLISATGNVTGNYFLGNGSQLTGISTSATKIFNGTSEANIGTSGGNANISIGGVSNVAVFTTTGLNITGVVSASGNITGGNLITSAAVSAASVSASGNITGGNLITSAAISAASVSASGNITGGNIIGVTAVVVPTVRNTAALTISTSSGDLNLQPTGNVVVNSKYINGVTNPVQNQDVATKIYVDNAVSTSISYHEPVLVATTTTLAATTGGTISYTQPNGAGNGVGALLTTTGAFNLIDTANVQTLGTRILVKDEANAVLNGVYTWANATNIVRSTDTNTYGAGNVSALGLNDYFFTTSGNVNQGAAFVVSAPTGTITFGTSNIVFSTFSTSQTYTANTSAGISLIGTVINAKVDGTTTAFDGGGNISVKASANLTTPNIGAATGTSLSVTANIAGNYFIGNGSLLTGIAGGGGGSNIANGTSNVTVLSSANITVGVAGTSNVIVWDTTGEYVTGLISATGNITGGNLNAGGLSLSSNVVSALVSAANITTTANISGNYFIGNGSLLTGIAGGGGGGASIANGTSNVNINTSGGNISFSVGGTANVVTVDSLGLNFLDTTTQDTGMNLGRVTTTAQWWNLP